MGFSAVATVVSVAASVYSSQKQASAQKKASKAAANRQNRTEQLQLQHQEKENALRKKEADLVTQRNRVKSIREARIRRGALVAAAGNTGTGGSSSAIGAQDSLSSQLSGNFAFGNAQRQIADEVGNLNISTAGAISNVNQQANSSIAKANESAATWGAIGGVASKAFDQLGGFKTIFDKID